MKRNPILDSFLSFLWLKLKGTKQQGITGKSMCIGIDVSKSEQEVFDISHSSELCS